MRVYVAIFEIDGKRRQIRAEKSSDPGRLEPLGWLVGPEGRAYAERALGRSAAREFLRECRQFGWAWRNLPASGERA